MMSWFARIKHGDNMQEVDRVAQFVAGSLYKTFPKIVRGRKQCK